MIDLYDVQTTDFTKNGDATVRALRCELMLSINGGWSLELELPYDKDGTYMVTSGSSKVAKVGKWNLIQEGAVIGVDIGCVREQWASGKTSSRQFFRIYDYRKTLKSITAIAYPIAMECNQDVLIENLAISKTPAQTMADLQAYTSKYTLSTNISATARAFSVSNTNLGAAIAVSFIDVFGGEIVYNNFNIGVREKIGDQNNASKYPVIYGRNMTGIQYEKDDSGIVTRICPISQDGIRLNGSGYVDSPIADSYPYLHKRYMSAPYRLLIDDQNNNSITATTTAQALQAIKAASMTPAQTLTNNLVHGEIPIPFAYIKSIRTGGDDDKGIIESVQDMATAEIYQESMLSKFRSAIKDGMNDKVNGAWAITEHEWTWHEDTSVTPHAWWYGYDSNEYARNCYVKIGKYYEYFNNDGYWEEYKRLPSIDWHQNGDGSWSIGYREGYYAHNEYVYMTVEGQMKEWWYDSDGWYDDDSSGDSDFGWHGNAQDGVWFGEEDAGSEDKSKYLHDCWAFIDGIYYFFDQYGYTDADPVHSLPDYQWGRQIDEKTGKEWFGNTDKSYGAKWLYNQWIKFASETSETNYWYVDENGYVRDEKDSKAAVIQQYTTGLANIKTVCNTQRDTLYTLLYRLMTEWCNKQYSEGVDKPTLTLTVSIVDLSKTIEYKNYEQLEKICLGDKVRCQDVEHDIYSQERIMGLVYDCIRGYNTSVVIGHSEASLGSILSGGSGSSVPSGFDTSAIETALTTHGNAIAVLQNGKQDKLTAGENITIVNNVISATGGGHGLEYWEETPQRFYRDYKVDGISADEGFKLTEWKSAHWSGYSTSAGYLYRNKNGAKVIVGEVSDDLSYSDCRRIVIASTNEADLEWEWATCIPSEDPLTPTSEWGTKETYPLVPSQYPAYDFGWQTATIVYDGVTWYIMAIQPMYGDGYQHFEDGDLLVKNTTSMSSMTCAELGQFLLEQIHASDKVDAQVSIGVNGNVFQWVIDGEEIAWINEDGTSSFGGEEVKEVVPLTLEEYDDLPSSKLTDDKAYFVTGGRVLDPNYTYHTYGSDENIVVRVYHEGENDEEIVWFFHNFKTNNDKGTGRQAFPNELAQYFTTGSANQSAKMYDTGTQTVRGWILLGDYLDGTINEYSSDYTSVNDWLVDAKVVMGNGTDQNTSYEDPYVWIESTEKMIIVNGVNYIPASGGGGTEVEANPSGSATSTLTKLRVDDTIYAISGGSGGGGSDVLYSGLSVGQITLSESIEDYSLIIAVINEDQYSTYQLMGQYSPSLVTTYSNTSIFIISPYGLNDGFYRYKFSDDTHMVWDDGRTQQQSMIVIGIK